NPDVICPIDLAGLFMDPADFPIPIVPIIHGTMTSEVPLDWRFSRNISKSAGLRAAWRYKSRIALNSSFKRMIGRMNHLVVDSEFTRRELMFEQPVKGTAAWDAGLQSAALSRNISVVPLGIDFSRYPDP